MGHGKHEHGEIVGRKLLWVILLNIGITIAEVIGGIISNSLALLSDALHNLADTTSIIIAYLANRISKKDSSLKKTFGFKRIEILAALLNCLILIAISIYLIFEAWQRFQNPSPIKGWIMFIVASVGLLGNLISVMVLNKGQHDNINVKAAYLHLLGDTLSSVVVIIGGLCIILFDVYWVDPLVTIVVSIYILKETISVFKVTINILMQYTPNGLDLNEVVKSLEVFPEIENVHHIHAWNLTDRQIHFECHIDLVNDLHVSESSQLLQRINAALYSNFNITHTTIQMEFNCCNDKNKIYIQPD